MKKSSALISLLLLSSLQADYHDSQLYYFAQNIPQRVETQTIYRIKIGAFSNLDNARQAQKSSPFSTYILKGEKYHSLYIGTYHDRNKAIKALNTIQQSYHDAYLVTTYAPLAQKRETSATDYMQEAKSFFRQGDYESALALYDKEMILHPNNHLAALEYARTLYMLGFYKQSKKAFLEVLSHNPPHNVVTNINYFLEKIEQKLSTNTFLGTLTIGATYDDNLGYNTSAPTFSYAGLELENETTKTKGFYTNLNLLLSHHYESGDFSWESSFYSYNELQQQSNIADLNLLYLSTTISKRYQNFTLHLPLGASHIWFKQEKDNLSFFAQPTLSLQTSSSSQLSMSAKYRYTNNETDDEKSYDTLGGMLYWTKFYRQSMLKTMLGYDKDQKEEGERLDISKENFYAGARVNYSLFTTTLLSLHYLYEESHYSDIDPALNFAREDKRDLLSLGIRQSIGSKSALSFIYTYLNNESNINSYSYQKNSFSCSYSYDF